MSLMKARPLTELIRLQDLENSARFLLREDRTIALRRLNLKMQMQIIFFINQSNGLGSEITAKDAKFQGHAEILTERARNA